MGSVYRRGRVLWLKYRDYDGQWVAESTELGLGEEKQAQRLLENIENRIASGSELHDGEVGPVSVRRYAAHFIKERRALGIASADDDERRLRLHILPVLGKMDMVAVRPRHVRQLVRDLRKRVRAGRTVINIYASLRNMYNNALVDEIVEVSPCCLKRRDLPPNRDRDPAWRETAVFTVDEVVTLISDKRIPLSHRVRYAILGLAGPRVGEAVARRWRDYDPEVKPLGKLAIISKYSSHRKREEPATKSGVVRYVPVHLTLARVLREWKLHGWAEQMGRHPTADDLILPGDVDGHLPNYQVRVDFLHDLKKLGMRRRRVHDLRRSFVSIGRAHGLRKDVMEWMTHGAHGDIIDMYTTMPWEVLCEELVKLRVELRTGTVVQLPVAVAAGTTSPTKADDHASRDSAQLQPALVQSWYSRSASKSTSTKIGGSARESNSPKPFLTAYVGFEDRGRHQPATRFRGSDSTGAHRLPRSRRRPPAPGRRGLTANGSGCYTGRSVFESDGE